MYKESTNGIKKMKRDQRCSSLKKNFLNPGKSFTKFKGFERVDIDHSTKSAK